MNRQCPECGAVLLVREHGQNCTAFIGCSAYPHCKYSESLATEGTEPNKGLDLAAFSETAGPVRDTAVQCLDAVDTGSHALARATLILLDYVVMWRKSDDPHAWDALDQARDALTPP
jgi:hypothetical protein